ncbi:aromatic amino acid transaminase [Aquicoccus sp. G2-2]|uniref:amino acid aminotransferase n=1 Tax=Aquicoccus sp. G2-2 TaxID=3092120 RepID=UPI002ADF5898|nr:amino acid aminotransferase [Aquicoccus sp. G2-2]MEA1114419.1 amino acid aminotransferase [Aquicoccus sp. G2-2]
MFETLDEQAPDKIIQLMGMFRNDKRDGKIDLGVGVYKNAEGITPIMHAVRSAEKELAETQTTKTYVAMAGDPEFHDVMIRLVLDDAVPRAQVAAAATPGGTGAVRLALELVRMASPGARVFVSNPTWPNHLGILNYLGIEIVPYRYFDDETRAVDFDGMMADLEGLRAGDVVLLHGCCHNPTGANLNLTEWQAVVDRLNEKGAVPMIDLAYQGFGEGLEADAAGTRLVAANCPEVLIAASCSKNFGIYRERTGILLAVSANKAHVALTQGNLSFLNRQSISFPPDHGARLVTMILTDPALRETWKEELEETRLGMLALREQLAGELQRLSGSDRFGFVAQHRGMFSRLGLPPEMVEKLRLENGIYMVGDSRINVAGLNQTTVPLLARAIIDAGA